MVPVTGTVFLGGGAFIAVVVSEAAGAVVSAGVVCAHRFQPSSSKGMAAVVFRNSETVCILMGVVMPGFLYHGNQLDVIQCQVIGDAGAQRCRRQQAQAA